MHNTWHAGEDGSFSPRDFSADRPADPNHYDGRIFADLFRDCIVWTSTVVMHRAVYTQVGVFDTALRRGQDYDYWLRVTRCFEVHKLPQITAVYRIHSESITSLPGVGDYEHYLLEKAADALTPDDLAAFGLDSGEVKNRLAKASFAYCYRHYHRGSKREARKGALVCIRHRPLRWRYWAYYLASTMGSIWQR